MADGSPDDMSFASHSSADDIFAESEWLEQIDGLIFNQDDSDSNKTPVGYCDGKLIKREKIRDKYGRLKPESKSHPVKKGSGIWNAELDDGDIFLIESLRIDGQYRRLGKESMLVRVMLEKVTDKTLGFVTIVHPGMLRSEVLCEPRGEEVHNKESSELAAMDISKSFLAIFGVSTNRLFFVIPALSSSILDTELEHKIKPALECSSDNDFVHFLSHIWADAAGDDPRWTSTDTNGNTVLHLAATNRNAHGETPLDALLTSLEESRTTRRFNALTEDISDQFAVFNDAAVDCLKFLNGGTEVTDVVWQRFKYGCTCGQCISGFLSPRMCFALECQADIWSNFLREDIEGRENNSTFPGFLPHRVQNDLKSNKSMRHMIPEKPNVEMVLHDASEWPPTSRSFLERGESFGGVVTMLFQRAMESDEIS
ncbi:hypothetical protein ASPACDRAFT_46098 [Aspergillus aculeatus ATCC 16872]|uniref:Uncharacterized protein n=1 Tax=Aspergillus aculeatus (strain ATCC 16872 / CBS 172.66 / WB 5094) TaxID=690307 RepID=A0A1L9WM69_ASPA1|nr:uncharacterized protein ASPACDRAFT_46098 [Aspergillus aculeatus ATCC 16872]OJJ97244.1 hypothetical protein ASPACDRAFT_46098 [Aspergillus aculeatus ATCC 16872]